MLDRWLPGLDREAIDEVPESELARVESDFRDSGAESVKSERNRDGTWKVVAVFRRPPNEGAGRTW
jgi:hypothetical protein